MDYDVVKISENTLRQIIIRPRQGTPVVQLVSTTSSNFIPYSTQDVLLQGGVPCLGVITNFCTIMIEFQASVVGAYEGVLSIDVRDIVDGSTERVNISLSALRISEPVSVNTLEKVSLRNLASRAGLGIGAYLQAEFDKIKLPFSAFSASDALMFDNYLAWSTSDWANNWANSALDFSGIAWDVHQAGTAVTRCHVVYADHYPRGGAINFHRKDGTLFSSNTVSTQRITGYDITVARIVPCLPEGWKIYPLIDAADIVLSQELAQTPYVNTHFNTIDGIRRISVTAVGGLASFRVFGTYNTNMPGFMQAIAQNGDSGSPSFIVVEGELVLVSTFSSGGYGGGGPFYGTALVQAAVQNAINQLQ